ncbi:MAG: flagellar biosynthesis protein FlhB [Rhodospirillales bacterium]|nr:flagellar biosynthesis protein FlhB [Rhodospirillales bacterium]
MSDEQDDTQKTEEPTQKKLDEARKKGQVALSREVNNWIMLLAATLLIVGMAPGIMGDLSAYMREFIAQAHRMPELPGGLESLLGGSVLKVLSILALPFLFLMFAAFIGPFAQVGPLFAPESLSPNIDKISPVKGFGRIFSKRSFMEFVKGIFKLALVGAVGFFLLYPFFGSVEHLVGLPVPLFLHELELLVLRMMAGVLMVLLVVAVIDLVFQRQQHYQKMRMSKQEVKDEYRQAEGDPHVRARLRQLRGEKARQRMMQAVPQADVIITNPTHYAIALKYDPETMDAPLCLAKGQDNVALRIREVAKEHNIIIYEDKPLARSLYDLVEVDQTIPAEQYQAVAKVISFVFRQKGRL